MNPGTSSFHPAVVVTPTAMRLSATALTINSETSFADGDRGCLSIRSSAYSEPRKLATGPRSFRQRASGWLAAVSEV